MTHGETIILRLLQTRNYYGYQLDSIIEENRMREWADIGFSSIYSILTKLEKKGFVSSHFEKVHGSPRRKVYEITASGGKALLKEVKRLLRQPKTRKDDFTVGIVASDVLTDREFEDAIAEYKAYLLQQGEKLEARLPEAAQKKERVALAIQRMKHLVDAEINWVEGL